MSKRIKELEEQLANANRRIITASFLLQESALIAYDGEMRYHDYIEMIKDVLNEIDLTPAQVRNHSHNIQGLNERLKEKDKVIEELEIKLVACKQMREMERA